MISAEAPVLFAKAAQIFITELTLRAWIHTEDNKRRTLQVRYTHRGVWTLFLSLFYVLPVWHVLPWSDHAPVKEANWIVNCWHLVRIITSIVIITLPLSSFRTFLPPFFFISNSSSTPLHNLGCLFGLLLSIHWVPVSVCIYKPRPHTSIPLRTIPLFSYFSLHWLWKQSQAGAVDPLFPPVPFCLLCCPKVE